MIEGRPDNAPATEEGAEARTAAGPAPVSMGPMPTHPTRPGTPSQIRCKCGTLVAVTPPEWSLSRYLDRHERVEPGHIGVWCPNLNCRAKLEIRADSKARAA